MLKCYAYKYVCIILGKTLKDIYNIKRLIINRYSLRSLLNNSRIPQLESAYPNQLKVLNSGKFNIMLR